MNKVSKEDKARFLEDLRGAIKPGDKIYTILKHVSSSGMSRSIDVRMFVCEKGVAVPLWLSYKVAAVCGFTFDDKREAVKVGGCGMDMGYHIVHTLSRVLFHDNFYCLGKGRCSSNDHTNGQGYRKGRKHSDGGYALTHSWL